MFILFFKLNKAYFIFAILKATDGLNFFTYFIRRYFMNNKETVVFKFSLTEKDYTRIFLYMRMKHVFVAE